MVRPRPTVDQFLAGMTHPRMAEIQQLREAILGADPRMRECVKWNAPSFGVGGEDRVTFRLQPGDRLELILHRGATKRDDADDFAFHDPSGLVAWITPDRGMVTFGDSEEMDRKLPAVIDLVRQWLQATS